MKDMISESTGKKWSYTQPGEYFVTLITYEKKYLFGSIENGVMKLSPVGEIVQTEFLKSFQIRKDMFCDAWVILPNHIHAIIRIEKSREKFENKPLQNPGKAYRPPRSVPSFVACFKAAATKHVHEMFPSDIFLWQKGYEYDYIFGMQLKDKLFDYIKSNAATWREDRLRVQ